jgi:hypothetical protein
MEDNYKNLDIDRYMQEIEMYEVSQNEPNPFHNHIMKQSTIDEVERQLDFVVKSVSNGEYDPLEAFGVLKKIETLLGNSIDKIKDLAIEEASKYESTFEVSGIKFEKRVGSKRFNFKMIDEWVDAKNKLSEIEEKYKQAYFSKQQGLLAVTDDGEELVLPTIEYSKDSLIVKK